MQAILADTSTWALVLGLLVPFAQSIVQRPEWSQKVRVALALGLALAVGLATVLSEGNFDLGNWFGTAGLVLAASQTAYALVYKPTGVAKALEQATTRRKSDYGTAA